MPIDGLFLPERASALCKGEALGTRGGIGPDIPVIDDLNHGPAGEDPYPDKAPGINLRAKKYPGCAADKCRFRAGRFD